MLQETYYNEERQKDYTNTRCNHWNDVAEKYSDFSKPPSSSQRAYHELLIGIYRHSIPEGSSVLELGCGQGELLNAVKPARGVGVDFSKNMLEQGKIKYPDLTFIEADIMSEIELNDKFDFIILSDVLNDVWDAQRLLSGLHQWCTPETRIIINIWSRVWQPPLSFARYIGKATPLLVQNWFACSDIKNLLELEGFTVVKQFSDVIFPFKIPFLAPFFNRWVAKLPIINLFNLASFIIARPVSKPTWANNEPIISVIVPARNESGNIEHIIARTPDMGKETELIFVEGNSTDETWNTIQHAVDRALQENPQKRILAMQQTGKGKGDAVRMGFAAATGDVVMILDADMTVSPEDLPCFYKALCSGHGEFINGVRLVYPMDEKAMRFCNLVANKSFGLIFSWLLGQTIKDTLCGTKVMSRKHYERIAANRHYFGDFDPFGDFDLIFGAAKQNLHIRDLPIRYRDRVYGDTNISRWKHGAILLRMIIYAALRIKFI